MLLGSLNYCTIPSNMYYINNHPCMFHSILEAKHLMMALSILDPPRPACNHAFNLGPKPHMEPTTPLIIVFQHILKLDHRIDFISNYINIDAKKWTSVQIQHISTWNPPLNRPFHQTFQRFLLGYPSLPFRPVTFDHPGSLSGALHVQQLRSVESQRDALNETRPGDQGWVNDAGYRWFTVQVWNKSIIFHV